MQVVFSINSTFLLNRHQRPPVLIHHTNLETTFAAENGANRPHITFKHVHSTKSTIDLV